MRGEKDYHTSSEQSTQDFLEDNSDGREDIVAVRVKKKKSIIATAYIVDGDGKVIYHLVSAWWLNTIMAFMVLAVLAILIVSATTYYNGERIIENKQEIKDQAHRIDQLEKEVKPNDSPQNTDR